MSAVVAIMFGLTKGHEVKHQPESAGYPLWTVEEFLRLQDRLYRAAYRRARRATAVFAAGCAARRRAEELAVRTRVIAATRAWHHFVVSPPGEAHSFVNSGSGELRVIAIHAAGRFNTERLAGPGPIWSSRPQYQASC
jgi:hypothetical protein